MVSEFAGEPAEYGSIPINGAFSDLLSQGKISVVAVRIIMMCQD